VIFSYLKKPSMLAALIATLSFSAETDFPRLHLHGYGEIHSNNTIGGTRILDPHRAVIGLSSIFSKTISFHMEVDFEHAFNEPELEFAYVDFKTHNSLTIRAGHMLLPVGALNEFHEPPLFFSVERPMLQKDIIPTSWGEVGAGVLVNLFDNLINVRSYLINGSAGLKNDSTLNSIRSGRTKGKEPKSIDVASVTRIESSPVSGLDIGLSGYFSGSDQSRVDSLQLALALAEADFRYRKGSLDIQGCLAYTRQWGEWFKSHKIGGTLRDDIRGLGGNLELAWHLNCGTNSAAEIVPFVRGEHIDTDIEHDKKAGRYTVFTGGISYLPVKNVAVKADISHFNHSLASYALNDGKKKEKIDINLGVGVIF